MKIDDFCKFLGISTPTIYNWKKEKPNLYTIVMNYKDEKLNNLSKEEEEILKLFKILLYNFGNLSLPRSNQLSAI